jgi:hypothetical protein
MEAIAPGIWRWASRHPEWHPRNEFGREVASYAVRAGVETLLIDPLLPPEPGGTLAALDALVAGRVSILVTIPYHTRSSEPLSERYDALVHGHPAVAKRLASTARFRELVPGEPLPGGARAFAIGRPRRFETPLYLPSHRALVFGDAVVFADGALRVWLQSPPRPTTATWYETRFLPTLAPLAALDVELVLVTHGPPVLERGREALARALAAPPWHHPPH